MKKTLLSAIAISLIAFSACKKDKSTDPEPETVNPFELEYSNLDVNGHKQNLEQAGIDFVKKIETLPDEKFVDVIDYLSQLEPAVNGESTVSSIFAINNAAKRKDLKGIFNTLATLDTATNRLSELYGVYTYNKTTGDWNETASNTELKFVFPASANSNSNNASLTFTYAASAVKVKIDGENIELPSSVTASLKADNKEELKLTSSYEYKSDGTPTKSEVNITLGSFSFNTKVSNTTTEALSSLSLKKGNETLLNFSADAKGSMSKGNAEEIDNVEDFVSSANASFEVMHIQLIGQVDFKAVGAANDKINYNLPDSVTVQQEAEAINKNSKVIAINKNDNKVIAKLTFKGYSETTSYCYTDWNNQRNCYTYTDSYLEPLLVFKDGSPLAFDSFFNNGFGKLIDELEDLGDRF